jgi:hypothetical protein
MHDAPVFLISTGRTGSTLLQRLLNCHPDLVVWGEHYGLFGALADPYAHMGSVGRKFYPYSARDNDSPSLLLPTLRDPAAAIEWATPWSLEEIRPQIANFMQGFFASRLAPGQRWGFKEVRYNRMEVLTLLREVFPAGRFIFLRRNELEVTRSKVLAWKSGQPWDELRLGERLEITNGILADVRRHYSLYAEFMELHPGVGIAVDYEQLLADADAALSRILAHLGLDESRYDRALADQALAQVITTTRT